jgi:L-lactate utilization protein LutB
MGMGDTDLTVEMRQFYEERAKIVLENVRKKHMEGYFAATRQEAMDLILSIIPHGAVIGRGDSITLNQLGVFEAIEARGQNRFLNPVRTDAQGHNPPREERRQIQRESLLTDIFLTSTNAITLEGTLVSTDGSGNRTAAMLFGPKKVLVVAGCNKIVNSLDDAMRRIRDFACPINALRHKLKHKHGEGLGWGVLRYTAIVDGNQPIETGRTCVILVGESLGM